jgi:hypothetical protein
VGWQCGITCVSLSGVNEKEEEHSGIGERRGGEEEEERRRRRGEGMRKGEDDTHGRARECQH